MQQHDIQQNRVFGYTPTQVLSSSIDCANVDARSAVAQYTFSVVGIAVTAAWKLKPEGLAFI